MLSGQIYAFLKPVLVEPAAARRSPPKLLAGDSEPEERRFVVDDEEAPSARLVLRSGRCLVEEACEQEDWPEFWSCSSSEEASLALARETSRSRWRESSSR